MLVNCNMSHLAYIHRSHHMHPLLVASPLSIMPQYVLHANATPVE